VVKIFDRFFKERRRYFSNKPKNEVHSIKTELDEHLTAINENTSEIQESYGCMNELSTKLDKLSERLEKIEVFLQSKSDFIVNELSFSVQPLTRSEQHVFLIIYALEDEKGLVSVNDIAKKASLPNYLVADYIARLTEKGIPLMRKYVNNIPYIKLNPDFKRLQAMENMLQIDTAQKELVNF